MPGSDTRSGVTRWSWALVPLLIGALPASFDVAPEATPSAAPAFSVLTRQDDMVYYPCMNCHQALQTKTTPRPLHAPHLREQPHGGGTFWCLTCHAAEDRNQLSLLNGDQVGLDDAYKVCAQCHAPRARDWRHGGHGKRVGNWQGERTIFGCPQCHNPHDPALVPSAPDPAPPVRIGFPPPSERTVEHHAIWDTLQHNQNGKDAP